MTLGWNQSSDTLSGDILPPPDDIYNGALQLKPNSYMPTTHRERLQQ